LAVAREQREQGRETKEEKKKGLSIKNLIMLRRPAPFSLFPSRRLKSRLMSEEK